MKFAITFDLIKIETSNLNENVQLDNLYKLDKYTNYNMNDIGFAKLKF
jgi:hypothetical protein